MLAALVAWGLFPVVLLLIMIASGRVKAYWAALIAVARRLAVADSWAPSQ